MVEISESTSPAPPEDPTEAEVDTEVALEEATVVAEEATVVAEEATVVAEVATVVAEADPAEAEVIVVVPEETFKIDKSM